MSSILIIDDPVYRWHWRLPTEAELAKAKHFYGLT